MNFHLALHYEAFEQFSKGPSAIIYRYRYVTAAKNSAWNFFKLDNIYVQHMQISMFIISTI